MIGDALGKLRASMAAAALALLTGCAAQTPLAPTVQVMPGSGHNLDVFQADMSYCKGFASEQVKAQVMSANTSSIASAAMTQIAAGATGGLSTLATAGASGAQNPNTQETIQLQYDNAFQQCMFTKGDRVPGYQGGVVVTHQSDGPDPAMVKGVQRELIRLGFLKDVADGAAGPKTINAIRQYQQTSGLLVDGTPSEALLAKLQATPDNKAAAAPANWVAPAPAAAPTVPVSATAAAPPAAPPAASTGWVAPAPAQ